jgi:hypothetical protein
MAKVDPGTKKVTLKQKDIGSMYTNPDESLDKYYLRYRIISEDGTQQSRWSQIYSVDGASAVTIGYVSGYTVLSNGSVISVSWKLESGVFGTLFDTYARWSDSATRPGENDVSWSDWAFVSEVSSSGFSINVESGMKWVQVYVQRQTFPKIRTDAAKLFQSAIYTTRSTTDSGLVSEG